MDSQADLVDDDVGNHARDAEKMSISVGDIVARGSRSTVHRYGHGAVVKVPDPQTPEKWILAEARYSEIVRIAGAPVPRLLGVEMLSARAASVWEYVPGPSLWTVVFTEPQRLACREFVDVLGSLDSDDRRACNAGAEWRRLRVGVVRQLVTREQREHRAAQVATLHRYRMRSAEHHLTVLNREGASSKRMNGYQQAKTSRCSSQRTAEFHARACPRSPA